MRHPVVLAVVLLLAAALPAAAEESCDPEHPDCSCGKLPVCIISGHSDGFYSSAWFNASDKNWKGFGEGFDGLKAAVMAEIDMANALAKEVPCIQPVLMDAYTLGIALAMEQASQQGLQDQLAAARAAGDAARVAEIERQITAILAEFDAGDFPWRDPALAQAHLARRMVSCAVSTVELSGEAKPNGDAVIHADIQSGPAGINDDFRGDAGSATDSTAEAAQRGARKLREAYGALFGGCREQITHCVTTNWELSGQAHECTTTTSCPDGQDKQTETVSGPGLGMGMVTKWVPGCCGKIAKVRKSDAPDDAEDRELTNEIWCDGTWNLRAGDMDCDGTLNATDSTPWPPGESPSDP